MTLSRTCAALGRASLPAVLLASLGFLSACHDDEEESPPVDSEALLVEHWNTVAIDASGLDHSPGFGQQPGPGRSSRAMAIVHVALFEVVNALKGGSFETL